MQERHIREIRDEKAEWPEAANSRLKALRQLFVWAKAAGHVTANPPFEVKRLSSASEGFHTWSDEEITRFEAAASNRQQGKAGLRAFFATRVCGA